MERVDQSGASDESVEPREGEDEAAVLSLEQRLVERAQAGDAEATKSLLARSADVLYGRVILPRVGDRAAAEDLLEATMLTAIEKLHTFRWQGRSIYFWLRQIATNKVIDYHRRNKRTRRLADDLAREGEQALVLPKSLGPRPDAALIAEQEREINRRRIDEALAKINARYRRAIELRLIEERPREACARQLDVSMGTFDVILFRAVRAFRKAFGER